MKTNPTNLQHKMKTVAAVGVLCLMVACAHEPKSKPIPLLNPITIAPSANPADELEMQNALMDKARKDQVNVLAPKYLEKANDLT